MSQPVLDYSVATHWRRQSWYRSAVFLALLIGSGVAVYRWAPPLWSKYRTLRDQAMMMKFTLPEDTIVYTELPEEADQLIKGGSSSCRPVGYRSTADGVIFQPTGIIDRWTSYGTNVFIHRLSNGTIERLCTVEIYTKEGLGSAGGRTVWIGGLLCVPETLLHQQKACDDLCEIGITVVKPGKYLRIEAGQPDPNDPSKFSIRYEVDGEQNIIDGVMASDGSQLSFTLRR